MLKNIWKGFLKLLIKHLNLQGVLADFISETVKKAIYKAVEKSDNKIDDAIVLALFPLVEKEALEAVEKINLNKILKVEHNK